MEEIMEIGNVKIEERVKNRVQEAPTVRNKGELEATEENSRGK